MKDLTKLLLTIGAFALVTWLGINYFIDGMPSWKTALLVVAFVLLVFGTMALCLKFFVHTMAARFGPQQPAQIVDADYRTLPNYQAPQAMLQAPQIVSMPRFTSNGTTKPIGMPARPLHVQTTTEAGEVLTVPLIKLQKFLGLPTPKRAEWTGDTKLYGDCLDICNSHGLLDRKPNGGFAWLPEYPLESRRQWAQQFEQQDAARARDE